MLTSFSRRYVVPMVCLLFAAAAVPAAFAHA